MPGQAGYLCYNLRGQLAEIRASTTPTDTSWNRGAIINHYSLQSWAGSGTDNNGNLKKQEVYIPHDDQISNYTAWGQAYDYDSLNRLQRVHEYNASLQTLWQQEYVYDRWGNRTVSQSNTWGTGIPKPNFSVDPANNNRLIPASGVMSYDAAGNVVNDTYTGQGARNYDAENRMVSAWANNQWQSYVYDAAGQRVRRVANGAETWQVYGLGGELLAEYAENGSATSPQKEYGYRGGQLLVTAEPNANTDNVQWLVADHLGTPRMIMDRTGSLSGVKRSDYLPFGEAIAAGVGGRSESQGYVSDSVRQGFTLYERDDETGLDYAQARYFSSGQGRFVSVDPLLSSGRSHNPMSWNRYSYSLNNPLKFVDPSGLYEYAAGTTDDQKKKFETALQKGKETLAAIGKKYGTDSKEYKDAARALNSYGDPNKANGVTVKFGALDKGTQGSALGTVSKTGANTVDVTIDLKQADTGSELLSTIAHEGSHAQDNLDFQGAFLEAATVSTAAAEAAFNGPLNVTHRDTETRAYGVSSVFAEFTLGGGTGESAVSSAGGTTTFKFDLPPVKSVTVGGESVWKSSWQKLDIATIRANRSAAIAKGLPKDARYAPNLDKQIQRLK